MSDPAVETTDGVTEVLTAEQRSRLGQLAIQNQGLCAFLETSVTETPKLTRQQMTVFLALNREWTRSGIEGDVKDKEELRQDHMSRALRILTDEQRRQWETMTGRPFEFPQVGR